MAVPTTGRLPLRLTPLVGRDAELNELTRALDGCRLLTLTGPGGTGKTRLALAAAAGLTAEVAWVELAPLEHPRAAHLAVRSAACDRCPRPAVLVLDHCEHLAVAVAGLAESLLAECPSLRILATSREPLGVAVERCRVVPPLDPADAASLFEARARLVAPSFAVTGASRPAVAQACARLGGLPLAIELAAARARAIPVSQLAERPAPPGDQVLRATLDWSYELLSGGERTVFRRLAVFADGFPPAAAMRVVAFGGIGAGQVPDLLARLADSSLLQVDGERYRLLAAIREYATDKLARAGELDQARRTHLDYYTEFAEQAANGIEHAAAARLEAELDRLDAERANLRAATEYAGNTGDAVAALRIVGRLGRYACLRGHYREVREWMDRAVAAGPAAPPEYRARALYGSGQLAYRQCDYEPAVRRLDAALLLFRELGDDTGTAACLRSLGRVAREQGRYARSAQLHAESLELAKAAGDQRAVASAHSDLGFVSWLQHDLDRAVAEAAQALSAFRALGDVEGIAWSLTGLGAAARHRDDLPLAATLLAESLELSESAGFREGIAWCQEQLGLLALERGDLADAEVRLRLSYAMHRELRDRWREASVLEDLAAVATAGLADRRRAEHAACLLGRAQATREAIGAVLAPCERPRRDKTVAAARGALGEAAWEAAWQSGRGASEPDEFEAETHRSPPATPALRVRALGRATVELDGAALTAADWGYAKPRELLFLLITSPPLTREQLGVALWPELSSRRLGNALHTALRELRRALGDHDWVVYTAGHYSVNRDRAFDCDVDEFESSLAAAGRARPASTGLPELRRAIAAYGGDFLAGMPTGEWANARRDELRRRFETALHAVGRLHMEAGRYQAAVMVFRRAVEHEPLNESAHRNLMTCWDKLGETARAVRHYADLTGLLHEQVGVPPAAETTALAERLAGRCPR